MAGPAQDRRGGDGDMRLGRVMGVPVLVTPSWWLGALVVTVAYLPVVNAVLPHASDLVTAALAVGVALLLGVSVLLHELGHCWVALRLGLPVQRVRLFLLGGVTELGRPVLRPRDEAVVAAAGPAVSVVLAAAATGAAFAFDGRTAPWLLTVQLAAANAVVAAFNLLPGLPLDGGLVLRAGVWALTGRRGAGTVTAAVAGLVVGVGLLVWGLYSIGSGAQGAWLRFGVAVLTSWFVLGAAFAELSRERERGRPGEPVPLAGLVQPLLELPAESPVADALAAAAGRGVLLVRADGVAAGLLDPAMAVLLAGQSPLAPAGRAAEPVRPESVLLDSELRAEPAAAIELVRASVDEQFLVVGEDGRPSGVLRRADVLTALGGPQRW